MPIDSLIRDTTQEAAVVYYSALRAMRPEERMARALELSDQMRAVLKAGVRDRHRTVSAEAIHREFLRLLLGWRIDYVPRSVRRDAAMNEGQSFLRRMIEGLKKADIPYMLAGSLASTYYGEYRATADIDVVIDPTESQLAKFLDSLGDEFYVSPEAARQALGDRFMFNVIHPASGMKADLVIRKNRAFSIEEFSRRREVELLGTAVCVVSPEDSILSKLEWSKAGESERQFRDAIGVAVVQWPDLDWEYLRRWAAELGLTDMLERLLAEAEKRAVRE